MKASEMYQRVTDQIIADLEAGAPPWVKPWRHDPTAVGVMPQNAETGRAYSGINIPILWCEQADKAYPTAGWLTYRQAQAIGGQVRAGEKGTHIVFIKQLRIQDDPTEEERRVGFMRTYSVFNLAQIDGLPAPSHTATTLPASLHPFVEATGATIRPGPEPMYLPRNDTIIMPASAAFKDDGHYYATMLHELGHWTGAPTRLNRDLEIRFGSRKYAAEELIAELTSAFLCAHLGIRGELRHAGYIDHWLDLLRDDNRAVFTAASKASQAADYLRAFSMHVS